MSLLSSEPWRAVTSLPGQFIVTPVRCPPCSSQPRPASHLPPSRPLKSLPCPLAPSVSNSKIHSTFLSDGSRELRKAALSSPFCASRGQREVQTLLLPHPVPIARVSHFSFFVEVMLIYHVVFISAVWQSGSVKCSFPRWWKYSFLQYSFPLWFLIGR